MFRKPFYQDTTASYHLKAGYDRLRVRRNIRIDMKRDGEAPASIQKRAKLRRLLLKTGLEQRGRKKHLCSFLANLNYYP